MSTRIPLISADEQNRSLTERLEMSTAEIGLSVRTTNCLEERGIFTVQDLLICSVFRILVRKHSTRFTWRWNRLDSSATIVVLARARRISRTTSFGIGEVADRTPHATEAVASFFKW